MNGLVELSSLRIYFYAQVTSAFKERAMHDRLKLQKALTSQKKPQIRESKSKNIKMMDRSEELRKTSLSFPYDVDELDRNEMELHASQLNKNESALKSQHFLGQTLSKSQFLMMGVNKICDYHPEMMLEAQKLSWEDTSASVSSKADWRQLLEKYHMPPNSAATASLDTDALLRCVVLRWIRWGVNIIQIEDTTRGIRFFIKCSCSSLKIQL